MDSENNSRTPSASKNINEPLLSNNFSLNGNEQKVVEFNDG